MTYSREIQFIHLFLCLIWFISPIVAQSQTEEKNKFSDNFGVSLNACFGNQYINAEELNTAISVVGLSNFSNYNYSMGLSLGLSFKRRIFIESEWSYISNWTISKNYSKQQEATLTGTRLITSAGYNIIKNEKIHFYPLIGWGGNFYSINIVNTESTNNSFMNAINEGKNAKINLYDQLIVAMVGFDYYFIPKHSKCADQNIRIGIRIGYQHSIKNMWSYGSSKINGPDFSARGLIVSLIFGSHHQ